MSAALLSTKHKLLHFTKCLTNTASQKGTFLHHLHHRRKFWVYAVIWCQNNDGDDEDGWWWWVGSEGGEDFQTGHPPLLRQCCTIFASDTLFGPLDAIFISDPNMLGTPPLHCGTQGSHYTSLNLCQPWMFTRDVSKDMQCTAPQWVLPRVQRCVKLYFVLNLC